MPPACQNATASGYWTFVWRLVTQLSRSWKNYFAFHVQWIGSQFGQIFLDLRSKTDHRVTPEPIRLSLGPYIHLHTNPVYDSKFRRVIPNVFIRPGCLESWSDLWETWGFRGRAKMLLVTAKLKPSRLFRTHWILSVCVGVSLLRLVTSCIFSSCHHTQIPRLFYLIHCV